MNKPDESPRSTSESPFMGPAVPPRSDAAAGGDDLAEPLAPFFGGLRDTELRGEEHMEPGGTRDAAGARPASSPDDEGDAGDDIPWLVGDEAEADGQQADRAVPLDEPSYLGGVPDIDIDSEPGLVSFDALEPEAGTDAGAEPEAAEDAWEPQLVEFETLQTESDTGPAAEPLTAGSADADSLDTSDWESALAMPPQAEAPSAAAGRPEPGTAAAARELHVEQAGGFRETGSAVAHEVADRLERIAHSLRVRAPNELLSGSGDPLEILIIGYVLGASHGSSEPAGDQASRL